jgi:ABC-type iron transport system FetAB ATPase subunit
MTLQIKLIILVVMLVIGGGGIWHYKSIIAERNQLRADVIVFEANEKKFKQTIEDERTAARQAVSDRADTQRALDELREGREDDPDAQEWAATPLPNGEIQRLCIALPTMVGCSPDE